MILKWTQGVLWTRWMVLLALSCCFQVMVMAQPKPSDKKDSCLETQKDPVKHEGTACGKLYPPKNGRLDLSIGLQTEPEKAFFSCKTGYELVGPTTIACKNSNWEGKEPICQAVDCGPPKAPENGRVEYVSTSYQSKAQYFCNKCTTLIGTQKTSCKRSRLWSRTTPKCIFDRKCPPLSLPAHAYIPRQVLTEGRPVAVSCGERVSVKCASGFKLEGRGIAVCEHDGSYSWIGAQPHCRDLKWT